MRSKKVKDHPNYIVYEDGRIFNLKTNKEVNQLLHPKGYKQCSIDGHNHLVHRVVAEAFIKNPQNKKEVDHINGDRSDNRLSNLRWATSHENHLNPLTLENIRKAANDPKNIRKMLDTRKKNNSFSHEISVMSIDDSGIKTIFRSITEATRQMKGNSDSNISRAIKGNKKGCKAYGRQWFIVQ